MFRRSNRPNRDTPVSLDELQGLDKGPWTSVHLSRKVTRFEEPKTGWGQDDKEAAVMNAFTATIALMATQITAEQDLRQKRSR